jgi:hypothetical protein
LSKRGQIEDDMKAMLIAAACAAAIPLAAAAEDNEAGVPLTPAEAAGAWTLETDGHALCVITLSGGRAGQASYAAKSSGGCGQVLGAAPTGWQPTHDGMRLTGSGGRPLLGFNRWSNSLFVSHRASGVDVQLRRGGPNSG